MITEEDVLKILETADDFPTPSTAAIQVAQMTSDLQVPLSEVAKLIMMDVTLSTKLLRVVNSSLYGLSSKVAEIAQAINILGYQRVGNLALGLAVMESFTEPLARGFDMNLFWEQSICNSVGARLISVKVCKDIPNEVFTAGLLQNIGQLFLAQYYPIEYGGALATAKAGRTPAVKVEREILGIDHAAVGCILVRHWSLPPVLEEAIRDHHFVEAGTDVSDSPHADLIRVANLSSLLTDVFYGEGREERIAQLKDRARRLFKLTGEAADEILERLPEEMAEAATVFEMQLRLKTPRKKRAAGGDEGLLEQCPRCGAKGLGKFCVDCGASLVKKSSQESNRRILIAEDSVATRRALAFVIRKLGYDVLEASNGAEAVRLARANRPSLILLDILMPVLGGIDALRTLRNEPENANVPIIMLTSLTDSETVISAIEAGANDYISKPYTSESIVDRVRKYMESDAPP